MKIKDSTAYKTFLKLADFFRYKYRIIFRLALYFFLIIVSFVFLFPFLYMLITSVKSYSDLRDISINWIPHSIELANYKTALYYLDFGRHFINSLMITSVSTLGHLLSCSFIAYGFARFKFRFKGFLFMFVIFSILIPPQVIILPQYLLYSKFNWINSVLPIIVPTFFGYGLRGGLYIFIFTQYFRSIPKELEDAAQVDGYGFFSIFFKIVIPISKSVFLVCCIISVVWHWNDYYEPAIYISKAEKLPLPSMITAVMSGLKDYYLALAQNKLDKLVTDGVIMAAITICMMPIFVLYSFLQKQFVAGIERTGLVE